MMSALAYVFAWAMHIQIVIWGGGLLRQRTFMYWLSAFSCLLLCLKRLPALRVSSIGFPRRIRVGPVT